jgi:hypothetical protein
MKVWARVTFLDMYGQNHNKGTQFTLPNKTPAQQTYLNSLFYYGIVTTTPPAGTLSKDSS